MDDYANRFVGAKFSGDFVFFCRNGRCFELRYFVAILGLRTTRKSPQNRMMLRKN